MVDLVKYWNTQITLPFLRAMSRDVLPAQASSVSSERIFSSSKLTCTRARNKISVNTVEKLQILKHTLRHSKSISRTAAGASELDPDDVDSAHTSDIMIRLGDRTWEHDAIRD
ncbi:hypothetical protein FRC08_013500 [Ceratobasidium sp. 394]|nr:hypothetical protein FRC08_013500 [Ceratobasidium sp. 394]KAG9077014.1 hypothetical protein FS749_011148 [Ceratobasidium sp. UAMH 11750]